MSRPAFESYVCVFFENLFFEGFFNTLLTQHFKIPRKIFNDYTKSSSWDQVRLESSGRVRRQTGYLGVPTGSKDFNFHDFIRFCGGWTPSCTPNVSFGYRSVVLLRKSMNAGLCPGKHVGIVV